jgi:hypothetical protein
MVCGKRMSSGLGALVLQRDEARCALLLAHIPDPALGLAFGCYLLDPLGGTTVHAVRPLMDRPQRVGVVPVLDDREQPRLDLAQVFESLTPSRFQAGTPPLSTCVVRRPSTAVTVPPSASAVADGGELLGQAAAEGRHACEEA